jgi:ribosomal protein S18 acetylase RimI-like enzyme
MLIRTFNEKDRRRVIELWELCGLIRPWNDPNKDIIRKMTSQPDLFFVLEIDGVVQATVMIGYDGHRGWMNYLGVSPEVRMLGLGRTLVEYAERKLIELGCPKLNLQVRTTNIEVIEFYKRLGFEQDDVVSLGKRLLKDESHSPPADPK